MNEKVAKRWMKFVAVSLWMATAGVVLLSIALINGERPKDFEVHSWILYIN